MSPSRLAAVGCLIAIALTLSTTSSTAAGNYGPSHVTKDLQALITADPAIGTALTDSLKKADWDGIVTLEGFYRFVDEAVRSVPKEPGALDRVRPFFYMVGQSEALKSNAHFQDWVKRYTSSWGQFLDTQASAAELDTFFADPAFNIDDYYVAPSGWLTWNQFFARQVKPGKRPIAGLGDGSTIVAPADGVLKAVLPVDSNATIVAKGVSYTIADLLAGSPHAAAFAGGTLVHAFQRPSDYHRIHVPFGGKVIEKRVISGLTWLDIVKNADGTLSVVDGTGFQWRQERGMVVIETEEIGLVAVLPIGMGYVDSVFLEPDLGAELYKGQEFGFFQFGGSDTVVIFQRDRVAITATIGTHYLQGEAIGVALAPAK